MFLWLLLTTATTLVESAPTANSENHFEVPLISSTHHQNTAPLSFQGRNYLQSNVLNQKRTTVQNYFQSSDNPYGHQYQQLQKEILVDVPHVAPLRIVLPTDTQPTLKLKLVVNNNKYYYVPESTMLPVETLKYTPGLGNPVVSLQQNIAHQTAMPTVGSRFNDFQRHDDFFDNDNIPTYDDLHRHNGNKHNDIFHHVADNHNNGFFGNNDVHIHDSILNHDIFLDNHGDDNHHDYGGLMFIYDDHHGHTDLSHSNLNGYGNTRNKDNFHLGDQSDKRPLTGDILLRHDGLQGINDVLYHDGVNNRDLQNHGGIPKIDDTIDYRYRLNDGYNIVNNLADNFVNENHDGRLQSNVVTNDDLNVHKDLTTNGDIDMHRDISNQKDKDQSHDEVLDYGIVQTQHSQGSNDVQVHDGISNSGEIHIEDRHQIQHENMANRDDIVNQATVSTHNEENPNNLQSNNIVFTKDDLSNSLENHDGNLKNHNETSNQVNDLVHDIHEANNLQGADDIVLPTDGLHIVDDNSTNHQDNLPEQGIVLVHDLQGAINLQNHTVSISSDLNPHENANDSDQIHNSFNDHRTHKVQGGNSFHKDSLNYSAVSGSSDIVQKLNNSIQSYDLDNHNATAGKNDQHNDRKEIINNSQSPDNLGVIQNENDHQKAHENPCAEDSSDDSGQDNSHIQTSDNEDNNFDILSDRQGYGNMQNRYRFKDYHGPKHFGYHGRHGIHIDNGYHEIIDTENTGNKHDHDILTHEFAERENGRHSSRISRK